MKRSVAVVLLLFLLFAALPFQGAVHAQGSTKVDVRSIYTLNRYGFAVVNETVTFINNSTSTVTPSAVQVGLGDNLSAKAVACTMYYSNSTGACSSAAGPYTVSLTQALAAGANQSATVSILLNGVVSTAKNGSLEVTTLSSPSVTARVGTLTNVVSMPTNTAFSSAPKGFTTAFTGPSTNYTNTLKDVAPAIANISVRTIQQASNQDFNPLRVYYAERSISVDPLGNPLVTDTMRFQNMGTTPLASLYVDPAAPPTASATVETAKEPRLINPMTVSLVGDKIDLTPFALDYPNNGVPAGTNFTLIYQYPLGPSYYTSSGGQITLYVPTSPPIKAFIDSYTVKMALPEGVAAKSSTETVVGAVTPWSTGRSTFAYSISFGFGIDSGVPVASIVFVILLVGLFVMRGPVAGGEEAEEEESSSELASAMINAFDEKTTLINSLWPEIEGKDPNEVDKAYFDELRGRLDTFRSRALQRLNEVKQKSASQKFSDVVNQMQATEREVDRAAKDKLNLYQQYYLRQMRKEVYDRLLPQYTKRLERALNQLSDELHNVQREAKLL